MTTIIPKGLERFVEYPDTLDQGPNSKHQQDVAAGHPEFAETMSAAHEIAKELELISRILENKEIGLVNELGSVEPGWNETKSRIPFSKRSQNKSPSIN